MGKITSAPTSRHLQATHYATAPINNYLIPFTKRGWPISALATVAGVGQTTIRGILNRTHMVVTATVGKKLMALSRETLMNDSPVIPTGEFQWMIGSLMFVGHPLEELADKLGYPLSLLNRILHGGKPVPREVYEDIATLNEWWGNGAGTSRQAHEQAAALGYRRPIDYLDDGRVWLDGPPDPEAHNERDEKLARKFASRDHGAWARLEALRLGLRERMTAPRIAHRLEGVSADLVYQSWEEADLRFRTVPTTTPGWPDFVLPEPGQEERLQEVLRVVDQWERDPQADAYRLVLSLGMMTGRTWAALDKVGRPKMTSVKLRGAAA